MVQVIMGGNIKGDRVVVEEVVKGEKHDQVMLFIVQPHNQQQWQQQQNKLSANQGRIKL